MLLFNYLGSRPQILPIPLPQTSNQQGSNTQAFNLLNDLANELKNLTSSNMSADATKEAVQQAIRTVTATLQAMSVSPPRRRPNTNGLDDVLDALNPKMAQVLQGQRPADMSVTSDKQTGTYSKDGQASR